MATLPYSTCHIHGFIVVRTTWTSSLFWLSWKQDIKVCRWVIKQFPIAMNTCQRHHAYLMTFISICSTLNSCFSFSTHSMQRNNISRQPISIISSDNIIRQTLSPVIHLLTTAHIAGCVHGKWSHHIYPEGNNGRRGVWLFLTEILESFSHFVPFVLEQNVPTQCSSWGLFIPWVSPLLFTLLNCGKQSPKIAFCFVTIVTF